MRLKMNCSGCPAWTLIAVAAVSVLAGCGDAPEPVFVYSETTDELDRDAQAVVQTALYENFGTPLASVAWLKMPVDFGIFEGEVAAASEDASAGIPVKWTGPEETQERLKTVDLAGAGLLWESGDYVGAYQDVRRARVPVTFQVVEYDREKQVLYLNAMLEEPPRPGDKFRIVGTTLQHGRQTYMQHCVHCHGVSGDGAGPTAEYLNPRPRDYRLGLFKFTSTASAPKKLPASRDDLHRVIRQGIPGTYMPSFLLLGDDEVYAVAEYVRWLSMRGMLENQLATQLKGNGFSAKEVAEALQKGEKRSGLYSQEFYDIFAESVEMASSSVADDWTQADVATSVIQPKEPRTRPVAESIARGRELYMSDKTKCVSCHGPAGRGDGQQTLDFTKDASGAENKEPGLFDDWGRHIEPRDLTAGIYRGGRRPIDLYRRVRGGIKGTPMPSFGTLTEQEVWDLVNYVMSVPYNGKAPPLPPDEKPMESKEKVAATDD